MTQCKSGGEAKDTSPSLLMLHTGIQLIQNLPGMPRAGIELFTLLLWVLSAFLVTGSLCSSNTWLSTWKTFYPMRM